MKYYAVTNDPAELMHYGIKGMKWGVIRTDAQLGHPSKSKKPRSAAYKKAESKLGKMMKSGIKKAEAHWQEYNSPENKAYRAYKKAEKRFEKHLQKAREGRLRYKGISDAEVSRITDRLALERQARQLSATEKQNYIRRLKSAIGEGVVQGVGSGFGRSISERISRGSILKTDRLRAEQKDRFDRAAEQRRIQNARDEYEYERKRDIKNMREDAKNEADREYYTEAWRRGETKLHGRQKLYQSSSDRAKQLALWKQNDLEEERKKRQEEARDKAYYAAWGKKDADREFNALYVPNGSSSPSPKTNKKKNSGGGAKKHSGPVQRRRYYYNPNP